MTRLLGKACDCIEVIVAAETRSSVGCLQRHRERRLGVDEADGLAARLRMQGVDVTDEKAVSTAAVMIGLGILAALMMAKK